MEDSEIPENFHFGVTPLYDVKPGDEDFESDMFVFEVEATFTSVPDQEDYDDDQDSEVLDDLSALMCTTRQETFMVERGANDDSFRAEVKCGLEGLGVPAQMQPYLVYRISNEAKSMERNKLFLGCKVIRLGISIDVPVNNLDEASDINSDGDVIDDMMVPASKSSMESLERVNVEESSRQCSICLEEILVGFDAIRLPCSHIYHGQCIRDWLEKSRVCPLCRFVI